MIETLSELGDKVVLLLMLLSALGTAIVLYLGHKWVGCDHAVTADTGDVEETYAVGDWMEQYGYQMRVRERIACEELGYPISEALYPNVEAWEKAHNQRWIDYIDP